MDIDAEDELTALMRESALRREQQQGTDDDDRSARRRGLGPSTPAALSSQKSATASAAAASPPRWRLFMDALVFLSHVLVDIGRRGLRLIEYNVPRYIAFVDRCLVHLIRVSVHPRKQVHVLRLLLVVLLVACVPYVLVTMYRIQRANNIAIHGTTELTEDKIRPYIIVERIGEPPLPRKRQALLRAGDDGLRIDDTTRRCENTQQGVHIVTDSAGFVCTRRQLDAERHGCCNQSDTSLPRVQHFSCERCDTRAPHCCDVYEQCVSCCMHPLTTDLRREFLSHVDTAHPVYRDPSALTVFQFCQFRCRTSSASVQHQNSYRSRQTYCYGIHRPRKMLATVNSDILSEQDRPKHHAANDLEFVPDDELELDPFYVVTR